jgi:hypothetical protein
LTRQSMLPWRIRTLNRKPVLWQLSMDARVNGVPATLASRGARPAHDE